MISTKQVGSYLEQVTKVSITELIVGFDLYDVLSSQVVENTTNVDLKQRKILKWDSN